MEPGISSFGESYLAQLVGGEIPHQKVMHAIELYRSKIAPAARIALGK